MWKSQFKLLKQYPKISLQEERRLIAKAKKGSSKAAEELVLRHTGFVIFRINKRVFPSYLCRFGEELFSEAILVLYEKIKTYNLRYRDRNGNFKPVRFSSYIWKRIDGFIVDTLSKETKGENELASLIGRESRNAKYSTYGDEDERRGSEYDIK